MQKKSFSKMSVYLNYLKRLSARQDFIELCRRETFNIYVYVSHLFPRAMFGISKRHYTLALCLRMYPRFKT
jgi:hypothetical protein